MNQQGLPLIRVLEIIKDISHKLFLEKQNGRNAATYKGAGGHTIIVFCDTNHIQKKKKM